MKEREALKLALEAAYLAGFNASWEEYNGEYPFGDKMQDPAENRVWKEDRDNYIKEALAQPEQEPVASIFISGIGEREFDDWGHDLPVGRNLLYITPPQRTWAGLTDEDIYSVLENLQVMHHRPPTTDSRVIFAQAIEAKSRSKNT